LIILTTIETKVKLFLNKNYFLNQEKANKTMNTKDVTILFWDDETKFQDHSTQIGLGLTDGKSYKYKAVYQFHNEKTFHSILKEIDDEELIFILVHVNRENPSIGAKKFQVAIQDNLNIPTTKFAWVSKGGGSTAGWYDYDGISQAIDKGKVKPYKKCQLFENSEDNNVTNKKNPHFDYAIIAALYEDEFEQLQSIFDFPKNEIIKMPLKTKGDFFVYHIGYLKCNRKKRVIVAVQRKTGMIDASIIATQMLEIFTPKYLLMSGVCGGGSDNKYGNVVLATEVFTFQRGKISDITQKNDKGEDIKIQLYDKDNKIVDYDALYDEKGNQIKISIEKFEKEPDPIDLKNHITEIIISKKIDIENEINKSIKKTTFINTTIKIKNAPIACSTMVINKDGFFEDTIRGINRKTAAVEMESYGVARACHFANKGETTPIIFKSVMDFTTNKEDVVNGVDIKAFAAWTSAQFMKCLFEMDII